MSQILLSGTATLDIVNTVDHFPVEDEEMRASASRTMSGGNAANTAVVLAALGHRCHLCALLADDRRAIELQALLELAQIDLRYCPHRQGQAPTSHIIMNAVNGSRTIIHFRTLPELEVKDFAAIPFEGYDWLHFEGRNVSVTAEVMRQARRHLKGQPISVEIEKPHPDYLCLFSHADVILFSRAFARSQGFDSPVSLLTALHPEAPQSIMVCAWGGRRGLGSTAWRPAALGLLTCSGF